MEDFTTHFVFPRTLPNVETADLAELNAEIADALEQALVGTRAKLAQRDPRESLLGARERAANTAMTAAEIIRKATAAPITNLRRALKYSEAELLSPTVRGRIPEGMDKADLRGLEREIRDRLMGMDDLQRAGIYQQAIEAGDAVTIGAIERAPASFPLLTPAEIEAGGERWAELHAPERYALLQDQRTVLGNLDFMVASAVRQLSDMAKAAMPDGGADAPEITPPPEPVFL